MDQFVIGGAGVTSELAGADGWGVGPPSCSCQGVNFYPFQPQFADVTLSAEFTSQEPFYGGPPLYPATTLVASALSPLISLPSGWAEGYYLMGFSKIPPSGKYSLEVQYQQNGHTTTRSATANFDGTAMLPSLLGKASAKSDHRGGLYVTVKFPSSIKQVVINVLDTAVPPSTMGAGACLTGLGFASLAFTHSGTQHIPSNLGNYGQGGAKTFCKGDLLNIQVIGFDYDDVHLGPPFNYAQRPNLPARADATYASLIATE
jgi:hypothetical protein